MRAHNIQQNLPLLLLLLSLQSPFGKNGEEKSVANSAFTGRKVIPLDFQSMMILPCLCSSIRRKKKYMHAGKPGTEGFG
uniref:Putative secreted protein n=1 Tax=Anopheles darlingi TaxID=43151 RepID=A0A2M4DKH5_ANODA